MKERDVAADAPPLIVVVVVASAPPPPAAVVHVVAFAVDATATCVYVC